MNENSAIDQGRRIDWSLTSGDYAEFRPGPPLSFYEKLKAHGIGISGQRILDLGTGTGVLARQFATQGCTVTGIDIASGQIEAARKLASHEGLQIQFDVKSAEDTGFESESFDVITANQCWLYFDKQKAIPEVKRLLVPNGRLVTSHFSWLPRRDPIACESERLILKFNPQWSAGDWDGYVPPIRKWAEGHFHVTTMFYYDEAIPFTRESWRGRIRACRGVGAALSPEEVENFDKEHDALLREIAPERFSILHRVDAHIFQPTEHLGRS